MGGESKTVHNDSRTTPLSEQTQIPRADFQSAPAVGRAGVAGTGDADAGGSYASLFEIAPNIRPTRASSCRRVNWGKWGQIPISDLGLDQSEILPTKLGSDPDLPRTAQLLDRATEQCYLTVNGDKHFLTPKGEKAGVEFVAKSRFGPYFLWPQDFHPV